MTHALPLLQRYRHDHLVFNDDIQVFFLRFPSILFLLIFSRRRSIYFLVILNLHLFLTNEPGHGRDGAGGRLRRPRGAGPACGGHHPPALRRVGREPLLSSLLFSSFFSPLLSYLAVQGQPVEDIIHQRFVVSGERRLFSLLFSLLFSSPLFSSSLLSFSPLLSRGAGPACGGHHPPALCRVGRETLPPFSLLLFSPLLFSSFISGAPDSPPLFKKKTSKKSGAGSAGMGVVGQLHRAMLKARSKTR